MTTARDTPLQQLHKGSARTASFLVRVVNPKITNYEYVSKFQAKPKTGHKFECYLLGEDATSYCLGYVKGSEAETKAAAQKFQDGTAWKLTKVALDGRAEAAYLNTPIKTRVDLNKTSLQMVLAGTDDERKLAKELSPPSTVADIAVIKSARSTDLLAVVRACSEIRHPIGMPAVADVTVADNSKAGNGKLAEVAIAVWGEDKLKLIKDHIDKPLVFFNLTTKYDAKGLKVTHWKDASVLPANTCAKAEDLRTNMSSLKNETDVHTVTSKYTGGGSRVDTSGPQLLSCAAVLLATQEAATAPLPAVLQLNWARLEEPELGSNVCEKEGLRIFFQTTIRDFSGAVPVAVAEPAALCLSGCKSKDEFLQRHADCAIVFPPFCNLRITRQLWTRSDNAPGSGALQPGSQPNSDRFNLVVADAAPMKWEARSAPNASSNTLLEILKHFPETHDGILAARLSELRHCPHYGLAVEYSIEGATAAEAASPTPGADASQVAPIASRRNAKLVAALIQGSCKSRCEKEESGYKVVTDNIVDVSHPLPLDANDAEVAGTNTLVAYCSLDDVLNFKLDPARGASSRVALVLICGVEGAAASDGKKTFSVEAVEHVDLDQVTDAKTVFDKIRNLATCLQTDPTEPLKRDRSFFTTSPDSAKKCRTLQSQPTDASM